MSLNICGLFVFVPNVTHVYSVSQFTFFRSHLLRLIRRSREAYAKAGAVAEEALPAARTIAAFSLEPTFSQRFGDLVYKALAADLQGSYWKAGSISFTFLMLYLSYALGWWWGGRAVKEHIIDSDGTDMSYGGVILSTFFSVMISAFSLAGISPNLSSLSTAAKAAESIQLISTRESLINPMSEAGEVRVCVDVYAYVYVCRRVCSILA